VLAAGKIILLVIYAMNQWDVQSKPMKLSPAYSQLAWFSTFPTINNTSRVPNTVCRTIKKLRLNLRGNLRFENLKTHAKYNDILLLWILAWQMCKRTIFSSIGLDA
jgi:hypothetical protein